MDTSLRKYPIADDVQNWLLNELWPALAPDAEATARSMSAYFSYYSTLCQRFSRDGGIHICVDSHQGILDMTKRILAENATRHELHSSLYAGCPKDKHGEDRSTVINATLDLCASLMLMAEVGERKLSFSTVNPLTWLGPHTLQQAVERHFKQEKVLQPDNPRLGVLFTARNLEAIGGMKIKWTSNVVDHLLLSDDDQTIFVFHHVGFLRYQEW